MWMVLPHFISSVAFGTIGLVACLTGLATRSDSLALAGLPILLIMLFEVTNRLDEMASITKLPRCKRHECSPCVAQILTLLVKQR